MLTGIRYIAVPMLGLVLLLVVACGDTQPLLDIDATVEARVELATASLVAPTAVPPPTYTPVPTATQAPSVELINYSSYPTEDIEKWIALAESKM